MYKDLSINTMEEVLTLASDQPFDKRNGRHRGYYLYRGLPNESFELKTSLQRNCGNLSSELESNILANFSKYIAIEADGEYEIDTVWKRMIWVNIMDYQLDYLTGHIHLLLQCILQQMEI